MVTLQYSKPWIIIQNVCNFFFQLNLPTHPYHGSLRRCLTVDHILRAKNKYITTLNMCVVMIKNTFYPLKITEQADSSINYCQNLINTIYRVTCGFLNK